MDKVIIVTSFASKKIINEYKNQLLIGVEKGIKKILDLKLIPTFCVSDFDTQDISEITSFLDRESILKLPKEKDYSDTEFAIKEVIERYNPKEIIILCSLIKRYDHSHSLLLLLKKYSKYNIKLVDDLNEIKVYELGTYNIINKGYSYMGVFGFPNGLITLKNVKYEVADYKLDFLETKAISNEFILDSAYLEVKDGSVLVVLSKDE